MPSYDRCLELFFSLIALAASEFLLAMSPEPRNDGNRENSCKSEEGLLLKMESQLAGLRVRLCSNDYILEDGFGTISSWNKDFSWCLIKLEVAHESNDEIYRYVLIKARSEPQDLREISSKGKKDVAAYWISEGRLDDARKFDASWWRGGAASTVTITPAEPIRV